jgi:hypothetical protein
MLDGRHMTSKGFRRSERWTRRTLSKPSRACQPGVAAGRRRPARSACRPRVGPSSPASSAARNLVSVTSGAWGPLGEPVSASGRLCEGAPHPTAPPRPREPRERPTPLCVGYAPQAVRDVLLGRNFQNGPHASERVRAALQGGPGATAQVRGVGRRSSRCPVARFGGCASVASGATFWLDVQLHSL